MIPLFKVAMSERAVSKASRVLLSGFIGEGPEVVSFEEILTAFSPDASPLITTGSCTDAIHLILSYLKIGPGDEVISTPLTCVATNAPILARGATIVWADIDPLTGLIDPEDVASKVTPRTKAIIGVDWTGKHADYNMLKQHGIPVIQDAAHNIITDKSNHGDYIVFSFGPIKTLVAGDGGAIYAPEHAREDLRIMRWYGLDRTSSADFRCAQDITLPGMKWHMNDINAAIGNANINFAMRNDITHGMNAERMVRSICNPLVCMSEFDPKSSYWVFPLIVLEGRRDELKAFLEMRGIMSSQVHARNDKHTAYGGKQRLWGVDEFDRSQLNIPCGWWLSDGEVKYIIDAVNAFEGVEP